MLFPLSFHCSSFTSRTLCASGKEKKKKKNCALLSLSNLHCYTLSMDLEAQPEAETVDESSAEKTSAPCEGSSIMEPYVGMEFDSEADAKNFYDEYARREGFIVRLDRCHRSEVDNRIISRRISCNKQGFHVRGKYEVNPLRKPRVSIREGCEAMILVKVNKSGKWVITRFIKEHSHPLMGSSGVRSYRTTQSKDRKIRELTKELERRDHLCQQYRRLLLSLMETVEEQREFLSTKVEHVVNSVKQLENDVKKPLDTS